MSTRVLRETCSNTWLKTASCGKNKSHAINVYFAVTGFSPGCQEAPWWIIPRHNLRQISIYLIILSSWVKLKQVTAVWLLLPSLGPEISWLWRYSHLLITIHTVTTTSDTTNSIIGRYVWCSMTIKTNIAEFRFLGGSLVPVVDIRCWGETACLLNFFQSWNKVHIASPCGVF